MKKTNKTFKRFAAITSASLLAACAVAPAVMNFAASAADYDITISAPSDFTLTADQAFQAYKIFNLSYNEETQAATYTLNSKYDVSGFYTEAGVEDFDGLLEWLNNGEASAKEAKARQFGDWLYNELINADGSTITPDKTVTAADGSTSVVLNTGDTGYYLVYGVAVNPNGEEDKNTVISQVALTSTAKTATVTLKLDAPSLDKEIKHNESSVWGDVGDNQIGDDVEYRIITSVPNIAGYTDEGEQYKYVIHDTMTEGLTFNDDIKVYLDKEKTTELDNKYYNVVKTNIGTEDFNVVFDINTAIEDEVISAGNMLYTYYTAKLNENALVASSTIPDSTNHNDNTAKLEYSNNPYDTVIGSQETGETPDITVYDWTFFENITKVDGDGNNLAGAVFNIYDTDPNGAGATPLKFTKDGLNYTINDDTGLTDITSTDESFILKGLDDSKTYYVVEKSAPAGYTASENKTFKLTAGYTATGAQTETPSILQSLADDFATDGENNLRIVNTSGELLPSTGGIGTTIFYLGGGAMAAIGGIYLISKRRMKKSEE